MKRDPATSTSKFNKSIEIVRGEPGQRKRNMAKANEREEEEPTEKENNNIQENTDTEHMKELVVNEKDRKGME